VIRDDAVMMAVLLVLGWCGVGLAVGTALGTLLAMAFKP
jgi:hypothetical protein